MIYEGDLRYDEGLIGRIFFFYYLGFESLNLRRKVCIEKFDLMS